VYTTRSLDPVVSRFSSAGLVDLVDVITRFAGVGFQHSQTAAETGAHFLLGHCYMVSY